MIRLYSTLPWGEEMIPLFVDCVLQAAGLARTYEDSGWCYVELTSSAIVKRKGRRLDLSKRGAAEHYAMHKIKHSSSSKMVAKHERGILSKCQQDRIPPIHPDEMKSELETVKVFTGRGDLPVVAAIYRRLFELVTPTVDDANFTGFGWGLKQGLQLAKCLPAMIVLSEVRSVEGLDLRLADGLNPVVC